MLMTGQPQAVPTAAGNEVRLQQPAGTAVFRVCEFCGSVHYDGLHFCKERYRGKPVVQI